MATKYFVLRVKLHPERDAKRIAWIERQENRSGAIRDLIDRAISSDQVQTTAIDLGAIRAVVEAALDQRLAGLSSEPSEKPSENPTLAARLDALEF